MCKKNDVQRYTKKSSQFQVIKYVQEKRYAAMHQKLTLYFQLSQHETQKYPKPLPC